MARWRAAAPLRYACKAVLLASCIFNFSLTTFFECLQMEDRCETVPLSSFSVVYTRSICVACAVSFAVVWLKQGRAMAAYKRYVAAHDAYSAANPAERRRYVAFRAAVASACAVIIVPVNVARLYKLWTHGRSRLVVMYFAIMYTQNLVLCALEVHFAALCYALHGRFAKINRHMVEIGDQLAVAGPRPLVETVELLKIRHRLVRDAASELNDLFAVPMGMSLCNLCTMSLFDIYYHLMNVYVEQSGTRSVIFIYLWMIQYIFRFFVIVQTAHATTKQASLPVFFSTVF